MHMLCAMRHLWRSEDNLLESVLSLTHVHPKIPGCQAQWLSAFAY